MREEEKLKSLSSDRPLIDPRDDRLGYATFAQHLALSLSSMAPDEGVVVAIHGPWGSGKTTALNFVLHFLKEEIRSPKIVHVAFNPWLYSGTEDLISRFFDQLIAVLAKKKTIARKLRRKIANFADLISDTPIPYSVIGKTISKVVSPKSKDITLLKKEVESLLRQAGNKILVTIDDIDRLSSEEHRQIFQLIKAVADFPYVIYLVVFDKEVAAKALNQIQGQTGEQYLQKIIQAPFELPLPDKSSLRRLLFEKLNKILGDTPAEQFDQTYWTNVYFEGIDHFIVTPRDVVRLSNILSVTYLAVKGEVNPVDFIAIEALRVFCPTAYEIIRRNSDSFAGHVEYGFDSRSRERLNKFHESWIQQLDANDRETVSGLIKRIFPKLESNYGAEWASEWRRKLRVCSPEKFPIYFRLSVPLGAISNSEMMAFLTLTSDATLFGKELLRLSDELRVDGSTRASEFLERLEDYVAAQIPEDNIPAMFKAFFEVGDSLLKPDDEGRGMFGFGNDVRIARNIFKLLRRINEPERYAFLRDAFLAGRSFAVMEDLIVSLGQQHGKWSNEPPDPQKERLISEEHLTDLEAIVLEKIRIAAKRGELINSPRLLSVLYRWKGWAGEDEVKRWISETIATDEGLLVFIERFLHRTYSQTLGDSAVRTIYRLDPKVLEPFVDPSSVVERARRLLTNENLTENQKIAFAQFLKEYEIRSEGKSPELELRS